MTGVVPTVYSWGANSYGQLGQGHKDDILEPRETTLKEPKLSFIMGGGGHSLALTGTGRLLSCGLNDKGQCGQAGQGEITTFTPVQHLQHVTVTRVAAGWDFSLALTVDEKVYSWGSNGFGQLGRQTNKKYCAVPSPVNIPDAVCDIACGLRHCVIVTATGKTYSWGSSRKGQLGVTLQGTTSKIETPTEVALSGGLKAKQVACGSYHSAVLAVTGEVFTWGCNKFGQMAVSPKDVVQQTTPTIISPELLQGRKLRSIHSGWTHMLALSDDGCVTSWGRGDYGQLGRSCDSSCDFRPGLVQNLTSLGSVTCGSEHCLAIDENGQLFSWGWNEHGMCATGDEVNVLMPHQVAALRHGKVGHIGCGAGHCFVVLPT